MSDANFIKKGSVCLLSEKGHYNFHYPEGPSIRVTDNLIVEKLSWINFNDLVPVKISSSILKANADKNIDIITTETVLWVEKTNLIKQSDLVD